MEQILTVSQIEERAGLALDRAFLYEDQESYRSGVLEAVRAILGGIGAERVPA